MKYSPILLYYFTILFLKTTKAIDVFCGNLTVHQNQRFGAQSFSIASQAVEDLKQCLELCCNIPNCSGVSMQGVIVPRPGEPNCQLIGCKGVCTMIDASSLATSGLISVVLHRDLPATEPPATWVPWSTTNSPRIQPQGEGLTTEGLPSEPPALSHALAPVWAVGLAIVVAVVCVGLNLGLLSAYICYRRQKSRKQTAQITHVKAPTLHAFNPTY